MNHFEFEHIPMSETLKKELEDYYQQYLSHTKTQAGDMKHEGVQALAVLVHKIVCLTTIKHKFEVAAFCETLFCYLSLAVDEIVAGVHKCNDMNEATKYHYINYLQEYLLKSAPFHLKERYDAWRPNES